MNKPKYKVPTMKEIQNLEWNGFKVVSTFSGCGGSCLGYRMANYKVVYANEFIEEAQKTYKMNHPNSYLDTRDIRKVTAEDIFKVTGLKKYELDLFDGSPPCSAFSTSGKREKGWGKAKKYSDNKVQQVENLFFEYSRLLNDLQPKVFVAENVSGLVKGKAKGYFKLILQELKSCGYEVKAQLLNSKWLGVPQARERIIFIGVRKDLGLKPVFPKPLPYYYTIKDAFIDLPKSNEEHAKELLEKGKNTKWRKILSQIPKNPHKPLSGEYVTPGSNFNLYRTCLHRPCNTITAQAGRAGGVCHPLEDRKFTIEELKRLSSIPDDFILTGTFEQQWERLGRLVPSVMMSHVAKTIEREILCKIK